MARLTPMEEYNDYVRNNSQGLEQEQTGFKENWSEQLGLTMSQYTPVLARLIPSNTASMRTKQLYDYAKEYPELEKVMGGALWSYNGNLRLEAAARYAHEKLGLTDVPIEADYRKRIKEEYSEERRRAQEISDRANWRGVLGKFAGIGHGSAIDPLYAVGMLVGYGEATTALQAFTRTALIEASIETAATPFLMDFHQDIGSEYTASEAFVNIMAAGTFGGVLAGGGKFLQTKVGDGIGNLRKRLDKSFEGIQLKPDIPVEDTVLGWSTKLKDAVAQQPELKDTLAPIIHRLDNHPFQGDPAADVVKLDAQESLNVLDKKPPKIDVREDLTADQAFDVEREQASRRWDETDKMVVDDVLDKQARTELKEKWGEVEQIDMDLEEIKQIKAVEC